MEYHRQTKQAPVAERAHHRAPACNFEGVGAMVSFQSKVMTWTATCERHIAQGAFAIRKQSERIDDLAYRGHDTKMARALLTNLIGSQRLHEEHHKRLLTMLRTAGLKDGVSAELP
jgi:hypothetical protein